MISEEDLLWLAGLLEGEGSFLQSCPSTPNAPAITLMMTDLDVVQHAAMILNVTVYSRFRAGKAKSTHQLRLRGKRAVETMQQLLPLMGARRRSQIERAIASYDPYYRSRARTGLTDAQIIDIYRRANSGESCRLVADEYSLTYAAVWDIKTGKSWAWLTGHKREGKT